MTDDFFLPPLSDAHWPEAAADLREGFAGGLNVYRTMAHHPALLRAWADLREHVVNQSVLGPQLSEVVILRSGLRLRSDYEWGQHVARARRRGLSDARIRSLRGPTDGMTEGDALLCDAVDALFDRHALPPAIARTLAERFGTEGVLDLIATVGFYSTLGFLLKTCGTPLDDDIAADLAANPLDDGG